MGRRSLLWLIAFVVLACLPAVAAGHIERPSYFPDPAADTTVAPAAGGKVPAIRTLRSSLARKPPGVTRVVCQADSMTRLRRSIAAAVSDGYEVRPTDRRKLSRRTARALLQINRKLRTRCRYREIQPAVEASGNNDRVVVMPGVYTEPTARAKPTHDPACDQYETNTEFGDPGALSYAYQFHCPNDQNLVAVIGRAVGPEEDPDPPREDRNGIPNTGPCIRCNLQLEGSGVGADDVVIDAGRVESGNKGPHDAKKDVAVRADRADGFVLRNITVRHAREHGIYVIETDGYVLDRFKAFYNGLYGTLTFVADHGLQQNCEGVGHGDSAVYPGAAPETGVQRPAGTEARLNQEIRWCDLHHNLAGYSGTDGNAIHFHDNNVYDNALGIQTDIVTAAGHPGFPGDSAVFEHNAIYSNNFNPYEPDSDVSAAFPFPVGTGMWIAGGNHHSFRENHVFDNWRRGTMLFTVPDALVCGPQTSNDNQAGCDWTRFSVSHYNRFHDNVMGAAPDGRVLPNGTDFWWDDFPGSRGNCWYRNMGPAPISSSPGGLPDCADGTDADSSAGTGNAINQGELVGCAVAYEGDIRTVCPWFTTPPKPGSRAARRAARRAGVQAARNRAALARFCADSGPYATCAPLRHLLPAAAVEAMDRRLADLQSSSPRVLSAWGMYAAATPTTRIPLGQFTCRDWRRAGHATRAGVVRRLTAFVGGRVAGTGGFGTVLTDADARGLFDARCRERGSAGFVLAKVYGYAAAFRGVMPPMEMLLR